MSTTVIASAYDNAALYLKPWSAPAVDLEAVRRVLEEHDLEVFELDALVRGIEGVVAVGLPAAAAGALARDLRAVGLTVRVVNDPVITGNARLSTAATALFLLALLTSPLILPAILAVINAIYILTRGSGLQTVAAPAVPRTEAVRERPERQALARIRALGEHLPAHVLQPLLERAEDLARIAAREPDGAAAKGLADIVDELQREHDENVTNEARALKAELARARRAAREVQ